MKNSFVEGGRRLGLAVAAALLATVALAQQDGGFGPPQGPPPDGMGQQQGQRGPSVERELKQLSKQLSLTADQQTAVKTVLTDRNQKIGALMQSMRPAQGSGQQATSDDSQRPGPEQFEQMRTQMKALREEANSKIATLLTADQATKFQALLKQRSLHGEDDAMPAPPDGDMGGGPPDGGGPGGGGPQPQM